MKEPVAASITLIGRIGHICPIGPILFCYNPARMIAHLSGTLLSKQATSVIVDVSGVGYEVSIPLSTFYELEDAGSNVQLRIYTHVKEDALQLYGFRTQRERELFINFISVSGIGPKLGIALLSGMSADELITAIKSNNLARLTLIPGVGRKTAERLIVDLREKMTALVASQAAEEPGVAFDPSIPPSNDDVRSQALSGLLNLGYQKSAAEKAIDSALSEDGESTVESVLRRGLRKLARL
jgi:Holliday junction DNA helicase RuvA